jgi:hypothetical protein
MSHDCGDDNCSGKSELAHEIIDSVLSRLDGQKIQDALDVLGHVSAMLEAMAVSKMKQANIELEVIDGWKSWRNDIMMEMEEDVARRRTNGG